VAHGLMLLHLLLLMMMTIKLVVQLCAEASRNWSWIAQLSRVQNQEVNKLLKTLESSPKFQRLLISEFK
jgi:hypothetical protein